MLIKSERFIWKWIKQGFGGMENPKSDEYIPDIAISQLSDLLDVL